MKRITRHQNINGNKKQKLQHQNNSNNKSRFENLANETIYQIFEYMDTYYVYDGFFNLNKRFHSLIMNSNLPIQINIPTMSKFNFDRYHKDLIRPNKHRINYLHLSNPFSVDIVFSPPRLISKFLQLETLILDKINPKYFNNILDYLITLPQLQSLTINPIDCISNSTLFYTRILRLPKLKYCKIEFESKDDLEQLPPATDIFSPIEYLVIQNRFRFQSFNNLLSYLPQLHHLTINYLDGLDFNDIEFYPIVLKHLKYVSLEVDLVYFNRLEKLIKNLFYYVEVLRLTTKYDVSYLIAYRWEELIVSHMPNLRMFDINHDGFRQNSPLSYHNLIKQFNSSFWIEKQWFFSHQHDSPDELETGIFYSTNPYRRNDFTFYWGLYKQICSQNQATNFNSVKHLHIYGIGTSNKDGIYFPNATELTIKDDTETFSDSIPTTLDHILPLKQLTKLIFLDSLGFPFEQLIDLLCFTPNLHTLKYDLISFNETDFQSIQKTDSFQYVSKMNQLKTLDISETSLLKQIQIFINLFPRLERLKTGVIKREIVHIIRFLLSKETCHLFLLCLLKIPKTYLRKLNMLIQSENLLDDYYIKLINRDLYLWW